MPPLYGHPDSLKPPTPLNLHQLTDALMRTCQIQERLPNFDDFMRLNVQSVFETPERIYLVLAGEKSGADMVYFGLIVQRKASQRDRSGFAAFMLSQLKRVKAHPVTDLEPLRAELRDVAHHLVGRSN